MVQVIITRHLANIKAFQRIPGVMKSPSGAKSSSQAVADAGRKTRTRVQKAVARQMAVTAGGSLATSCTICGAFRASDCYDLRSA